MSPEYRRRLHAVRAELDALADEAEAAYEAGDAEVFAWSQPTWRAWHFLYRARVAVTSADKALASGEDPRAPSGVPPLKRIMRARAR